MELTGAISEGEWSSLSGMYTAEEAAFMAQLLTNTSCAPNQLNFGGSTSNFGLSSSTYGSGHENAPTNIAALHEGSYERASSSNFYRFSQESSDFSGGSCSQFPTDQNFYLSDSNPFLESNNNGCVSTHFFLGNIENNGCFHLEDDESMNPEINENDLQLNIEAELQKPEPAIEEEGNQAENSKKRSRGSGEVQRRRNVKSKKTQKLITSTSNNEEDGNSGHCRQSTSSYCSEDESNASQDPNPNGPSKTRASRGSATDPQSLYARRRRERINERLRILQSLVPNGTKVDISTMLEEAVQYVKFLQLQIKLLSSDDLWMYAPIAYNGMDIGLNLKLNTLKES